MKRSEIFVLILAALVVIGFFLLIISLTFRKIILENENLLYLAIGYLAGNFTTIIGYYFGSSEGSKIKTQLLSNKEVKETKEDYTVG